MRFTAEGDKKTLVELEHKNLERFGEAQERMRAAFESSDGWSLGLESLARQIAREGR